MNKHPEGLSDKQIEALRWLVETCGGEVSMHPDVPMYPLMQQLYEVGFVGRRLHYGGSERTLWEACDPSARTVLDLLDRKERETAELVEVVRDAVAEYERDKAAHARGIRKSPAASAQIGIEKIAAALAALHGECE